MPIARYGTSANLRKVASGGGESFGVPRAWTQSVYGSGQPIQPLSGTQDTEIPRTIDFPISVNATLTPRTGYLGLMPFSEIKAAYDYVTECKLPVWLIAREMSSFIAHLVDDDGNEVSGHDYQWMCESPDRKKPFHRWLTRFLKNAKVYDAASVYLKPSANGSIEAMHCLDGSTLFVIVDQFGNTPDPEPVYDYAARSRREGIPDRTVSIPGSTVGPSSLDMFIDQYTSRQQHGLSVPDKIPAYTQIIKGTPFSWWSADQIWYMPQSDRLDAPYGESFIEAAWPWINILVNVVAFELGHYRTGNMPEGLVTLPPDWLANPDQLDFVEDLFNSRMTSDPKTQRNRLRFFPHDSKFEQTKKADFPKLLYQQCWQNILHAIGIPPSEFGDIPGGGLGGKGFKEGAQSDLSRNTLNPHRNFVNSLFNYVLERDGVTDVHFALDYPTEEIDPDKQRNAVYEGMAHGTYSLNDARGQLNLDPVGDPDDPKNPANWHLIVAGASVYVVEELQAQAGVAVPMGGNAGGEPMDTDDPANVVDRDGKQHTPEDMKTLRQIMQNIQEHGTLDGKFISVPSGHTFSQDTATKPVEKSVVPLAKHCGVCPEDDDYFGAPISREIQLDFPADNHANGVEIVAMCPPGLPPKPGLWKPEGGERESLREWIGGAMYPREEAAYLLDRSLGFYLVPLAYVGEADEEEGAVIYYSQGMGRAIAPEDYAPQWTERAAVLEYIISQQDRGVKHNYGTHPDGPTRMVLFDNGLSFPVNPDLYCNSPFCALWVNQPLSDDVLNAMRVCRHDVSTWSDIRVLVGAEATQKALACLDRLLEKKMVTHYEGVTHG